MFRAPAHRTIPAEAPSMFADYAGTTGNFSLRKAAIA
jgi:hypothetical protein